MGMQKSTFALFTCDQWKSRDSHRFIGTATSLTKVRTAVKSLLKNGIIENNTGNEVKAFENADDFCQLDYFFVMEVPNNRIEVDGSYYV